jgi:hypothetical protein
VASAPTRSARTYQNLSLVDSIIGAPTFCQKAVTVANCFLALKMICNSAAGNTSADTIAQFGQHATVAVPFNLNFTWTTSKGSRQCGQQSAWSSLRLTDILRPRRTRTS